MFKIFKKKSEAEILQKKYEKLMNQYHKLSTINRTESDKLFAQAQELLNKINVVVK